MDTSVDQSVPRDDLLLTNTGAYFYNQTTNDINIDKFDRAYEQYKTKRKIAMQNTLNKKLEKLNAPHQKTPVYERSLGDIMVGTKDAMFNFLDDILQFDFSTSTFVKNNRLFYFGVVFIMIAIILMIYYFAVNLTKKPQTDLNKQVIINMS